MNKEDTYYTTNINLAAALLAKDIPLSNFAKEKNIITFIFEGLAICEELENLWLKDKLEVFAYKYSQSLKRLKNIVYGGFNAS